MALAIKVLEDQQLSALSRLFSSSLIKELSKKGQSPLFARLAKESSVLKLTSANDPVSNLFDAAFALLKKKNYRHEYICRNCTSSCSRQRDRRSIYCWRQTAVAGWA